MTEQEKTLLGACLKGEKSAWDSLVLQYSGLVDYTIKSTLKSYQTDPRPDRVEDLFQDCFLSLLRDDFKKLRQFKGERGCSLATWLRVIAARLTIDFLRRAKVAEDAPDDLPLDQPNPYESLIDRKQETALSRAVEGLAPKDRLLIQLHFQHSLSAQEIAAILRVSVGSVYTKKSRILDKLRQALKNSGFPG